MKTTALIFALTLSAGQTLADDLSHLDKLNQDQFGKLIKDLGPVSAYRGVTPGNALGLTGFDIGVEATQSKIENAGILALAGGTDSSTLYLPKVHVLKGLPFGIDIGAFVSKVPGIDASLVGAELRYQVIDDGLTTPSVALRASGSRTTGISQLSLSTQAIDLMVSKKLTLITPYAGLGTVRSNGSPKVGTLKEVNTTDSRVFVGINANVLLVNLAVEAEKLGAVSSLSAKVGFRF